MSQIIDLPIYTQCSLCDIFYAKSRVPYLIYKCFCCGYLTPYCFDCEIKLQKLFGNSLFFKCSYCKKLTSALDKIKINPLSCNININSVKQEMKMGNSNYNVTSLNNITELNSTFNINQMIQNLIDNFKKLNVGCNSNTLNNSHPERQILLEKNICLNNGNSLNRVNLS